MLAAAVAAVEVPAMPRVIVSWFLMTAAAGLARAEPEQAVFFVDGASPTVVRARTVGESGFGSETSAGGTTGEARGFVALRSPDGMKISLLALDASGRLGVRVRTDTGWSRETVVGTGVPVASPAPFAGAYAAPSGNLVAVHASTGSSVCTVRAFGDTLGGAVSAPLSLASTPVRVRLAARPASNEVLLVAQDSSQRLSATVWNGSTFRATADLDTAYTGGVSRWDCSWLESGGAIVVWARSGESTVRVSTLRSAGWDEGTGPSASSSITRLLLADDPSPRTGLEGLVMLTGAGQLDASVYGDGAWSGVQQVGTGVDTSKDTPLAAAFEGDGGALQCAWLSTGSERVSLRRRTGAGDWEASGGTAVIGDGLSSVTLTPLENRGGTVLTVRTAATSGGGSTIGDYVVYSSNGSLSDGDRVTYNGAYGANVSGVSLPAAPTGTAGTANVTVGTDGATALAPGNYRDLSFGDRARINFSAGAYVFRKMLSSGVDARFVCDTASGDVSIIFLQDKAEFKDRWRIERSGSGGVAVHIVSGLVKLTHDNVLDAAVLAYNGSMEVGDRTRLTGHLLAKGSIVMGHDGVHSLPSWALPGASVEPTHRLYAAVIAGGAPGAVTDLTIPSISGATAPPIAVSAPRTRGMARVVRWREAHEE